MGNRRGFSLFRLRSVGVYTLVILLIISIVSAPSASIAAVTHGLTLCARTLLPSLFPFFVCCNILIRTGFVRVLGRWLTPVMRPLFHVSGAGAFAFVMGIISGYPVGAKMVVELRESGMITQTEARRLLPFCNNSGPLFILGAVGITLLGSQTLGLLLYGVHILAALAVGVLFGWYRRGERESGRTAVRQVSRDASLGEVFSDAVKDAVLSVLNICGFVLFFSAVLACLEGACQILTDFLLPLTHADGALVEGAIKGVFEMTNGVSAVAACGVSLRVKLTVLSFLLGFGGISVHMQVLGIVSQSDIGMSTYLAGKTLQGLLAAVFTWIACQFLPVQPAGVFVPPMVETGVPPVRMLFGVCLLYAGAIACLAMVYYAGICMQRVRRKRK